MPLFEVLDQPGPDARLGRRRRTARARRSGSGGEPHAEIGIAVFRIAFERWVEGSNARDLAELIRESLDEAKAVTATA